jgi:hypothetical protein
MVSLRTNARQPLPRNVRHAFLEEMAILLADPTLLNWRMTRAVVTLFLLVVEDAESGRIMD